MSSPERLSRRTSAARGAIAGRPVRGLLAALGLTAALGLGGCQVTPLYATADSPISGSGMTTTLANVDVAPIEGRVGQKIRNDLLFLLDGGGEGGNSYVVNLQVNEKYTNVITRKISGLPGGRNVRLVVDYSMKKAGEPEVLTSGRVTRIASMDYFNQRFANDRAMIDAENRLSKEVAADIQLRLAAFLATGKNYDKAPPVGVETDQIPPTAGNSVFRDPDNTYGMPDL